jgi:hypothetical protein
MARFLKFSDTVRIIQGDTDMTGYVDRVTTDGLGTTTFTLVGLSPTVTNESSQPNESLGGEPMTANREFIQRQIERTSDTYAREMDRLNAQLEELDRYGDDPFEDGDVIVFHKLFVHEDGIWSGRTRTSKPYFYAATRANGLWYTTGPKSPKAYTWHDLRKWIDDGGTVDGIWYVETLKPIEGKG